MSDFFTLRPATSADAEFVYRLTEACMRTHAEQTWGRWDEHATRNSFEPATHSIIVHDDKDIGCLEMTEVPTHFVLEKLYVSPPFQGHGIATTIVNEIMELARPSRKPIRLRILAVSPARRFFERLGFIVTHSTAEGHEMVWQPA